MKKKLSTLSCIEFVNEKGYLVNNLFQLTRNTWQANLRHETDELFTLFGRGKTPQEALLAALKDTKAKDAPVRRYRKRLSEIL